MNEDVGLLRSGRADSIAALLGNGIRARYELEVDGRHRGLEDQAKSSDSRTTN